MSPANWIANNSGMSIKRNNSQEYVDPINYRIKISNGDFCFFSIILLILIGIWLIPFRNKK